MKHVRRAATKDVVLGVIGVLVIGAAIYFFATRKVGGAAPTGEMVGLYCANCREHMKISYADMDELIERRQFATPPGGRAALFKCPKCGLMTAARQDEPEGSPTEAPAGEK